MRTLKVLVTGGAGFIGSHIVDLLLKDGWTPVVIDHLKGGNKSYVSPRAALYELDVNSNEVAEVFQKEQPDYVIHQAAQVDMKQSLAHPVADANNNILATLRLLTYAKQFGIRKFVYASSCAVYGNAGDIRITEETPVHPISAYGISKHVPELYLRLFRELYGLPSVILRYANVYGPRQTPKGEGGVVSVFLKKLLSGKTPVIFGDGEQTRDFVYVKDVAAANIQALHAHAEGTFNVGCDQKTSINDLYHRLSVLTRHRSPPSFQKPRKGDIRFSRLRYLKAKAQLGWIPKYSLSEGLKETYEEGRIDL